MTTTLVYANSDDGYLKSYNASLSTARAGSNVTLVSAGTGGYYGQSYISSTYSIYETFMGFTYAAVASTELLTSAHLRIRQGNVTNPSETRNLEIYRYAYGTLTTADWQDASEIAALPLVAQVTSAHGAKGLYTVSGSDELMTYIPGTTSLELMLISNKTRAGATPTADHTSVVYLSESTGTTDDPCLVLSTVTRSTVQQVLGGQTQLSDGSWVVLESTGGSTPIVTIKHVTTTGSATSVGLVSLGTSSTNFDYATGAQGLAVVSDSADNIYLIGKTGNVDNSVAAQCWKKGGGLTWVAQTLRSAALPEYDTKVNQVAATYHTTAAGTIVVVASHTAGFGVKGNGGNSAAYLILSVPYLLAGTGSLVRASGSALGTVIPTVTDYSFNAFANETGTGLDIASAGSTNPTWGYVSSYIKDFYVGVDSLVTLSRYILNSTGTGFSFKSTQDDLDLMGHRDANGKVRVVPVSSTSAAVVCAAADEGGISIKVQRHAGTTGGSVTIGSGYLSDETITSMPTAGNVGAKAWWDVVYNSTENSLWVYYVNASNARQLMRTSFDLNTFRAVRDEVTVATVGSGTDVITAVRLARNASISQRCLLTIAHKTLLGVMSTTYTVDGYNLAPNPPTLEIKAAYDATAAGVFNWTFNDPNSGDTQSAYEFEVVDTSDGSLDIDTGKVVSATSSRTVTGGTLANAKTYQWRVKTWDALDVEGTFSDYGTFQTASGGSVTITDPALDSQDDILTDDYIVAWSVTGTTQAAYKVRVLRASTLAVLSDSGWVAGTATTYLTPGGMLSDIQYKIEVTVRNAGLVESATAVRYLTPVYGRPEVPIPFVSVNNEGGYIQVSATNPVPGSVAEIASPYSFETDVAGFTTVGGTLAQDTTLAHEGVASAKLTQVVPSLEDTGYPGAIRNNAEGGTTTTAVTTGNSGGASGNAFTAITSGSTATVTFDDTQAAHGTLSYKLLTGGTLSSALMSWDSTVLSTPARLYGRAYVRFSSVGVARDLIRWRAGGSQIARLRISATNHLELRQANNSAPGTSGGTGTATIAANTWYRIEWDIRGGAAQTNIIKLFTGDSEVVDETITGVGNFSSATTVDEVGFGNVATALNLPAMWYDNLDANATNFPGPASDAGAVEDTTVRTFASLAKNVIPGVRYTCRYWAYSSIDRDPVSASVDYYDTNGDFVSSMTETETALVASTWTLIESTGTAPTGAVTARYGPTFGGEGVDGSTFNFDELIMLSDNDIPDVAYNQVLRREFGSGEQFVVIGTFIPGESFKDFTAASGITYEYRVRAVA